MSGGAGVHVRTAGVVVRIGAVRVLDDVSVEIAPATLTAVVGPSGAGKTTLFNVLARLQAPSAGAVYYDGVTGPSAATRIGLVHQAFALLSLLTAAENVELAAQLRGLRPDEVDAAAGRCLSAVDLRDRADHLIEELSGGEQQRVAVARALVGEPNLLLADEPTAHLDQHNRDHLIDQLRQLAGAGTTVVIATHDPDVADQCDALIELRAGQVVDA